MALPLNYRIRLIQVDDAAAIQFIQSACYPAHLLESTQTLLAKCALSPQSCWLAESRQGPVGYLFTHPWQDSEPPALNQVLEQLPDPADTFFLHDLAIHPSARKQGLAQALIRQAMAWARKQRLCKAMLVAVQGSQAFWQQQGFNRPQLPGHALQEKLGHYGPDATCLIAEIQ